VKDLPRAAGVSKEAVAMSLTWLQTAELVSVDPDPSGRGKIARLTDRGAEAQEEHTDRLDEVESAWSGRYGRATVDDLRASLQRILDQPGGKDGQLSAGLVTPPGGWRGKARYKPLTAAFVASPSAALPHYPMVLHRGGWPDGS
jgi:hypothetical protein